MSNFGSYTGKQFLEMELKPREWLIENIIRENDSVLVVGNEKSGKSLLMFQLICSLTTKQPFFDKYNVPKETKVTYVQVEGELSDSQDRMKRMIKTLDFNPELFHLMFEAPLELQVRNKMLSFRDEIHNHWKGINSSNPDVVIIDPIYFAFSGSLSNDEIVREFLGNVRILKDSLDCAVILVHHTHKQRWNYTGDKIEEGDEATFGSKFLKAWADHILLFIHDNKKDVRTLSCNTQRSGSIIKQCSLKLIEPDPLYFEETINHSPNKEIAIIELLKKQEYLVGLSCEDICKELDIKRDSFYSSIKKPIAQGFIEKVTINRPVKYKYCSK